MAVLSGKNPAVTVLMPAYNAEAFVRRAVKSVLRQTLDDLELLVYDDASTDRTPEILAGFARRDRRVKVIRTEKSGYAVNLARGLDEAKGRYIARMDADDICTRRRLEWQVAALEGDDRMVAVGGQGLEVDSWGWAIQPWRVPEDHETIDRLHMAGRCGQLIHPAMIFRAEVLRSVGYDPSFEPAEDFELWLRLAESGRLGNVPGLVLRYRRHTSNVSVTRNAAQCAAVERALREAHDRRGLSLDRSFNWAKEQPINFRISVIRAAFRAWNLHTGVRHLVPMVAQEWREPEVRDLVVGLLRRLVGMSPRAPRRLTPGDAK
ncbi:MAG: glycosyltransferase family 2 protein [Planctomycetota bacterium]